MRIAFCVVFLVSTAFASTIKINPFSDEFIDYINSNQNTWKAGRNFDKNTPPTEIKKLLGALKSNPQLRYKPTIHSEDIDIPETFDARTNWPECSTVISSIPDQSACGSCWAVSAASAMSDRRCIVSGGSEKVPVSAEDLLSCCKGCGYGCDGGYIDAAWNYWGSNGIATGGKFNSSEGCKPYSFQPCSHHVEGRYLPCAELDYDTPRCASKCSTGESNYKSELTFAKGRSSWLKTVVDIQREIIQNGPVSAGFTVYEDFIHYKSGVYQYTAGTVEGGHAVRIIGWGTENNVPFWLISNSWNEDWGDKGLFKIIRGKNEVGIESEVFGSIPKL